MKSMMLSAADVDKGCRFPRASSPTSVLCLRRSRRHTVTPQRQ